MTLAQVCNEIEKAAESFQFEYVSGGYFRDKTVPKGTSAVMFHGDAVLRGLVKHIIEEVNRRSIVSKLDSLMQQAIAAKLAKLEEDKLQATGEVKTEHIREMTPHEFSCVILGRLNADIKVHTVEIRTLCLMIQEQATQLRMIREVTNQGVRSGRVVGEK